MDRWLLNRLPATPRPVAASARARFPFLSWFVLTRHDGPPRPPGLGLASRRLLESFAPPAVVEAVTSQPAPQVADLLRHLSRALRHVPPPGVDLDVRAAAQWLGLSERRVRELCASGTLEAQQDDRRGWRIPAEQLAAVQRRSR